MPLPRVKAGDRGRGALALIAAACKGMGGGNASADGHVQRGIRWQSLSPSIVEPPPSFLLVPIPLPLLVALPLPPLRPGLSLPLPWVGKSVGGN